MRLTLGWRRWARPLCWLAALLLVGSAAHAQARLDKSGVTLYWGLVPAPLVSQLHDADSLHGEPPKDSGRVHHLVVALYDTASGRRIEEAAVRAQLRERTVVSAPPKPMTPMRINETMSYGQLFRAAKEGPYPFKVWVRLAPSQDEIEFAFEAWSPHRSER